MDCVCRVATTQLDQHALDFAGNYERILASCLEARRAGARYRLGPELEVTGYGCEDHFFEGDTFRHAWQVLAKLLAHPQATRGMLCDFGMPVLHRGVRYNCRVFCLDHRVVLIRPKLYMANDGNYREHRYFTPWHLERPNEVHNLPPAVLAAAESAACASTESDSSSSAPMLPPSRTCPFGFFALESHDGVTIASETCEELFTPNSPHIALGLDGIDIVSNGSGSHHELRKLHTRVSLMQSASSKSGGVYMYANHQGCDGGRLYFDGCSMIFVNGEIVGQASQFAVSDVEVVTADVDVEAVRSYRSAVASRSAQAAVCNPIPRVHLPGYNLSRRVMTAPTPPIPGGVKYHTPNEEIALGPACWLWDYLRRSGACGFLLPLSGGADSATTCALVGIMCKLVHEACRGGDVKVLADLRRVMGHTAQRRAQLQKDIVMLRAGESVCLGYTLAKAEALLAAVDEKYVPNSPKEIACRIMHTAYLGTRNSSAETQSRARRIAEQIGTFHMDCEIDPIVEGLLKTYEGAMRGVESRIPAGLGDISPRPNFKVAGGHWMEDLALQNIQARGRMVFTYMLSQLLPSPRIRGLPSFLLVLGSANVDEALRGYFTKYDCSAADLNPIGGICKTDLRQFLVYASEKYGWTALGETACAVPTAELQPLDENAVISQTDEQDMGMSYAELTEFGYHRKVLREGPYSMCRSLIHKWGGGLVPREVATKVQAFYRHHFANRHKMTTLTPSYHAEQYSPDDNRFDLRPFLYPQALGVQNEDIERLVTIAERNIGSKI